MIDEERVLHIAVFIVEADIDSASVLTFEDIPFIHVMLCI